MKVTFQTMNQEADELLAEASKNNLAILVDLSEKRLYLMDKANNSIIKSYIVASGKPSSPSPAGTWKVISMGKWSDGFGSRWIGLNVPWGKYGIHGTNKPGDRGSAIFEVQRIMKDKGY